jgi:hypothetical protein
MRKLLLLAAGLAVGGVVAVIVGTGASAQGPAGTTITVRELNEGSKFRLIDHAPRSESERNPRFTLGDQLVFSNPLVNSSNTRVGTLYAVCTIVTPGTFQAAAAECSGTYRLQAGHIHVQTLTRFAGTTVGAVTGGTGAYANQDGTFRSVTREDEDSDTTITLAG